MLVFHFRKERSTRLSLWNACSEVLLLAGRQRRLLHIELNHGIIHHTIAGDRAFPLRHLSHADASFPHEPFGATKPRLAPRAHAYRRCR